MHELRTHPDLDLRLEGADCHVAPGGQTLGMGVRVCALDGSMTGHWM